MSKHAGLAHNVRRAQSTNARSAASASSTSPLSPPLSPPPSPVPVRAPVRAPVRTPVRAPAVGGTLDLLGALLFRATASTVACLCASRRAAS